jgi:mannose-6-phosphate isomerase-like protein (cupin superfamily)
LINLIELKLADLASTPLAPETVLANTDEGLVKVQMGTRGRHYHSDADEIQYVVAGSGTERFVDKTVSLKSGDLLVIPKGTPHAGTTDGLKILTIQLPLAKNTVRIP